jgi:DnaJ-domain-containing protein 1
MVVKAKAKKGFMDGYKTYNPEVEGYGNEDQWNAAFKHRMGWDEAKTILNNDDAYSILGIVFGSTFAEIKSAFRKMAMKYHPDRNPGVDTTEKMQKIIAAYTLLTSKK